ncbi:DUF3099 domain-containing protein [Nocardioides sp. ChNu-153]|uniref:DUF3099 domain-containing protein n=1 Tax=unclassified Nocardioides TaxID=2615069 RepID=UPI002404B26F|nr:MULTISPECIES: DUF3099 domain-containing protein [unclassified Nocardioides]MDF9715270.1 DUF3099 domain-containing protein [Nocardioides sp. ChNu-99]MDN7122519.1 DUF3099 domain-containing protein [Nocardioides sp. ChNu-153]
MPTRPRRTAPKADAVRITTAPVSPTDELDQRRRRYFIAMSVRTLCFLGAFAVGPGWLRWVLLAGAVFLPYFAVVAANVTSQQSEDFEIEPVDAYALPPASGETLRIGPGDDVAAGPGSPRSRDDSAWDDVDWDDPVWDDDLDERPAGGRAGA